MFQIDDYIKIKKKYSDRNWYTNETFQIISFVDFCDDIVTLNKNLYNSESTLYCNEINTEYIEIDKTYYRKEKILKIIDRKCSK